MQRPPFHLSWDSSLESCHQYGRRQLKLMVCEIYWFARWCRVHSMKLDMFGLDCLWSPVTGRENGRRRWRMAGRVNGRILLYFIQISNTRHVNPCFSTLPTLIEWMFRWILSENANKSFNNVQTFNLSTLVLLAAVCAVYSNLQTEKQGQHCD